MYSRMLKKKKVTCRKTVQTLIPDQDEQKRTRCAQQAVALSLQWRPSFGLGACVDKISDVWIARQIRLVTKYEPRVIFAALACWEAWVSWCAKVQRIHLDEALESGKSSLNNVVWQRLWNKQLGARLNGCKDFEGTYTNTVYPKTTEEIKQR